jgi:hypothetical protein
MKNLLLATLSLLVSIGAAFAAPTDIVPRGDIAYDLLAGLAAQGRLPGYTMGDFTRGDRLYTRLEIARMLAALTDVRGAGDTEAHFAAAERVLRSQFTPELQFLGVAVSPNTMTPAQVPYVTGSAKLRLLTNPTAGTATLRAAGTVPIGRDAYAAISLNNVRNEWHTLAMPGASTAIRPSQRSGYPLIENAYLRVNGRALDVSAGLMPLRWGPGATGALLFSDEAANVGQVKAEKGFVLPGTLGKRIGRLRFTQFLGSFEEKAVADANPNATGRRRYLSGRRLETETTNRWQFSLGEGFKSTRLPDPLFSVILPFYVYQNNWTTNNRRRPLSFLVSHSQRDSLWFNYLADANVGYRLDKKGTLLYFDLNLDDVKAPAETGDAIIPIRRKIAQQFGAYFPEFDRQGRLSARIEYTHVDQFTYTHTSSPVAWSKEDFPLGFPGGPNGQIYFGRLDVVMTEKLSGAIEGETRQRVHTDSDSGEPNVNRVGLYATYSFRPNIAFGARYEYRRYSYVGSPTQNLSRLEANATIGF